METPGCPTNGESSAFQIVLFHVREHLHQEEYCKLKNKFWNASKNSATSALADLQVKLELHSFYIKRTRPTAVPRSRSSSFGSRRFSTSCNLLCIIFTNEVGFTQQPQQSLGPMEIHTLVKNYDFSNGFL